MTTSIRNLRISGFPIRVYRRIKNSMMSEPDSYFRGRNYTFFYIENKKVRRIEWKETYL